MLCFIAASGMAQTPPPLRLVNPRINGDFASFTLTGPADSNCIVQFSQNLIDWVPFATNTIPPGGAMIVIDPEPLHESGRFYRAELRAGSGIPNDYFSNRVAIATSGGTVFGSNTAATKEAGEPNHGDNPGGRSVWWSWTAPSNGIVTVSTDGSSFDTELGVYVGGAVGSLIPVAQDDDGGETWRSRVVFVAIAGTTYQIAVDGFDGESGAVQLTVKAGLINDAFADRLPMGGSFDLAVGSNVGATQQPGEPEHWPGAAGMSVWWTWTAPQSGPVTMVTSGSSFDTVLAVYTGSDLSGLTLVASNNDLQDTTSRVTFAAIAGAVYQIAVDSFGGASGMINLGVMQ